MKEKLYKPYFGLTMPFIVLYWVIIFYIFISPTIFIMIYLNMLDSYKMPWIIIAIFPLTIFFIACLIQTLINIVVSFFIEHFAKMTDNAFELYGDEIKLCDISYIVIDEGGLSIEEKYNKHQISLKPATLKLYIKDSYHVVVERPSFRLLVDLRRKCKFEKLALKHPKRKFIYIPIIALLIGLFIAFNIAGNMGAI